MPRNSNLIIAIVFILVILTGAAFMFDSRRKPGDDVAKGDELNAADSSNVAYNNYTREGVDETPDDELEPAMERLTYGDALTAYAATENDYRFQFLAGCRTDSHILTVKQGSKFMLDNRDEASHVFKMGDRQINLSTYAFAIITAEKSGEFDILCDGTARARILVLP